MSFLSPLSTNSRRGHRPLTNGEFRDAMIFIGFLLLAQVASAQTLPAVNTAGVSMMLQNAISALGYFLPVIEDISIVMGLVISMISLFAFTKSSREGGGMKIATIGLISGILLSSLSALINAFSMTMLNHQSDGLLTYTPSGGTTPYALTVKFAVYVVQLVGLYGVIKSVLLVRESAYDRSKFNAAIIHFLGGIFAINIITLVTVVSAQIGGTFQSTVMAIIQA